MIKNIRTTERNTLMLHELEYPFDSEYILKKSKSLKRRLLEENTQRIPKKIAVLGGSTTHDIIRILELFLLNQGIEPTFYESEYGMYWEDAMFGNEELNAFGPDLVYIHTSFRNLRSLPEVKDSREQVEDKLRSEFEHFQVMWEKLADTWHCPIIQDNFELPYYRLMGNQDGADFHGRTWYVNRMNQMFADYAAEHQNFLINDICYQSAAYGLDEWSAPFFWHMYKYSLCLKAIPWMAHNVANIMKSLYGKNKKSLVLDLDNTLWGGIVGDDGPENLEIGQETNLGQVYAEFQQPPAAAGAYILVHRLAALWAKLRPVIIYGTVAVRAKSHGGFLLSLRCRTAALSSGSILTYFFAEEKYKIQRSLPHSSRGRLRCDIVKEYGEVGKLIGGAAGYILGQYHTVGVFPAIAGDLDLHPVAYAVGG